VDGGAGRVDVSESVRFDAADRYALGGTLFAPEGEASAICVVAPAMAVLQRMYRAFAGHLADHGIATLTFDYRGIGESAPGSLRGFEATATQWGTQDITGAIDFARRRFGDRPTFLVGHSIGGQLLGLCPRAPTLSGAVLVAAQSGYWKMWSGPARALMWTWWRAMPRLVRATGYLPMQALKQGENVPKGVALEWAQWGRHPRYLMSSPVAHHDALTIPLLAYLIEDDRYAVPRSVEELLRFYASAPKELRRVSPGAFGTRQIGHFGIFRREFRAQFYDDVVQWILAKAGSRAAREARFA
jgi:predicted alpha/beta hydrolase